MTGKIVWKERGTGKGSIAVAAGDGHVYLRFQDGILALVKALTRGFSARAILGRTVYPEMPTIRADCPKR